MIDIILVYRLTSYLVLQLLNKLDWKFDLFLWHEWDGQRYIFFNSIKIDKFNWREASWQKINMQCAFTRGFKSQHNRYNDKCYPIIDDKDLEISLLVFSLLNFSYFIWFLFDCRFNWKIRHFFHYVFNYHSSLKSKILIIDCFLLLIYSSVTIVIFLELIFRLCSTLYKRPTQMHYVRTFVVHV